MLFSLESNFLQSLGWAVINSLWQMAFLWLFYKIVTKTLQLTSHQKANLSSSLIISGFIWAVFSFFRFYTESGNNVYANKLPQINEWLQILLPYGSILYISLLIIHLIRFFRKYYIVRQIKTTGLSKTPVDWRLFAAQIAAQLNIKSKVEVWFSSLINSPVTVGFLKPVILLPAVVLTQLSPSQIEAVIVHELTHIKRHDYLINLITQFIQTLFYFNPFVKLFSEVIETEREKSCDEVVLQYQYDKHSYASALYLLEKNKTEALFAVAATGTKSSFLHRIEWILNLKPSKKYSALHFTHILAALLCIITINVLLQKPSINTKSLSSNNRYSYANTSPFIAINKNNSPFLLIDNASMVIPSALETAKNQAKELSQTESFNSSNPEDIVTDVISNPFASFASTFQIPQPPALKEPEMDQVRKTIASTRRILQEDQWQQVEKSLAEVFTSIQKEKIKSEYEKEIAKIDLSNWENTLQHLYNDINWQELNNTIAHTITNIRLDSLQHVYSKAMHEMAAAKQELINNQLIRIPDSDINLEKIKEKEEQVKSALEKIKAVKKKKIVKI